MRCRFQTAWVSLLTIFLSTPALAGGLSVTEFGHPLQGASGAGAAALAQDASTAFTNPAGIMMLDESEWMVTAMGIVSEIEFEQDTSGTTVSGNNGGDAGGFAPGAALFYANPFNDSFGFGFSFNAISAAIMDYDSGFVGRYWAEEVEILVVTALPSIA